MKLVPEVKEKWLTALRSGDYQQATGVLKREESFCCLGVLCDLAVQDGIIDPPESVGAGVAAYGAGVDWNDTMPPHSVRDWAYGLKSEEWQFGVEPWAIYDNEDEGAGLATLNDSGATFTEIANLIEVHL